MKGSQPFKTSTKFDYIWLILVLIMGKTVGISCKTIYDHFFGCDSAIFLAKSS
jgi:hypothetical protein